MCVLIRNGQPCRVAFSGEEDPTSFVYTPYTEPADTIPVASEDDSDYVVYGREKTAITSDLRDARTERNHTRKVITTGKRKPTEVSYLWRPYPHEPVINATVMLCDTRDVKYIYHDSHGKHGRRNRRLEELQSFRRDRVAAKFGL